MKGLMKKAVCGSAIMLLMVVMVAASGCGGGSSAVLPTTGTVSGTVVDSSGNPVADAVVVIGSASWAARTNILGQFAISGITPGTQPFRVMVGNNYAYKSGNVSVTAGVSTTLTSTDLTLTSDTDTSNNPALTSAAVTKASDSYTVTITVAVTDANSDISAVTVACPELEMSKTLNDAGTSGDATASDGTYSVLVELTAAQTTQLSTWHFSANDQAGNVSNVMTITYGSASTVNISSIIGRNSDGSATYAGKAYTVEGIVLVDSSLLANKKLRIHVQDSTGGIAVGAEEDVASGITTINQGDKIRVTGVIIQEPESDNSIGTPYIKINSSSDVTVVSTGNTLPAAYEISGTDCVSQYQTLGPTMGGKIVKLKGVSLVDSSEWPAANAKSTDVQVKDASGNIMVIRIQKNSDIKGTTAPSGSFDVTGLVRQHDSNADGDYNDDYTLWPRTSTDITTSTSRIYVASN